MPDFANIQVGVELNTAQAERNLGSFLGRRRTLQLDDKISTQLQAITKSTNEFDLSLTRATNRVFAFAVARQVLQSVQQGFQSFIRATIDVENSLTKIQVNLNETSDGLKKFGADLFNVARQTGQTFEVASKAAEEFARQGLGAEETIKRTRDALILSRIAALDTTEAVNDLTGAVNSYAKEALTTTDILNKFVALDTRFAVSSKDLADGLQRAGAVAADAGISIDKFLGMITAVKQATGRDGAVIANGFKTIFERTRRPETLKEFSDLGIATKNLKGEILPVDQILQNLAKTYDTLSESQQQQISKGVANIQQINIFKALLGDLAKAYNVTGQAAEISSNATTEALGKNLALNKTLQSAITATSNTITQFFANLGKQDVSPVLKDILNLFETARKFLSGESSNKAGEAIGNGLLKGISNVLTGPALAAITIALGGAFGKVLKIGQRDIQGLLGINSIAKQQAEIQATINNLINGATQAQKAEIAGARTLLELQTALLTVARERAAITVGSSALVNSLVEVSGPFNKTSINPALKGIAAKGFVPSAADPVATAIQRELSSGVPRDQIYIDRDQRLISSDNPQGLMVANRRDEPVGGFQGVNRILAQGGDPKKAGLGGKIPSFADPLLSRMDIIKRRFGIDDPRYDAGTSVTGKIPDALTAAIARSELEINKLSAQTEKVNTAMLLFNKSVAESTVFIEKENSIKKALYGPKTYPVTQEDLRYGIGPSTAPQGAKMSEIRRLTSDINYRALTARELKGVIPSPPTSLLGDNLIEDAVTYDTNLPAIEAHMVRNRPSARDIYRKQVVEQNRQNRQKDIIESNERAEQLRQRLQLAANRKIAQNAINVLDQEKERALRVRERLNRGALTAAFVAPIAAGFIPEGQGGTFKGQALSATSNALQFAGIGAIGGPEGAVGGAILGAFYGAFKKATKSVEEFSAEIDDAAAVQGKIVDSATQFRSINQQIGDVRRDSNDPRVIDKLERQRFEILQGISDTSVRSRLAQGFSNPNEEAAFYQQLQDKATKQTLGGNVSKLSQAQGQDSILTRLGKFLQAPREFFGITGSIATLGLTSQLSKIGGLAQQQGERKSIEESIKEQTDLTKSVFQALNKENISKIDTKGLQIGNEAPTLDQIVKLKNAFSELGATVDITDKNYRESAGAVLDAIKAFRQLKAYQDRQIQQGAFAPTRFGAFQSISPTGEGATFGPFAAARRPGMNIVPGNQYTRDVTLLSTISRFEELGAFGEGGLDKNRDAGDPLVRLRDRAKGGVGAQNVLKVAADFIRSQDQYRGASLSFDNGQLNPKAILSVLGSLSKSFNPETAELAKNAIGFVKTAQENAAGLGSNKPVFQPYKLSYLGGGSIFPTERTKNIQEAQAYFDSHKLTGRGAAITTIRDPNKVIAPKAAEKNPYEEMNDKDTAEMNKISMEASKTAINNLKAILELGKITDKFVLNVKVSVDGLPNKDANNGLGTVIQEYLQKLGVKIPNPLPPTNRSPVGVSH